VNDDDRQREIEELERLITESEAMRRAQFRPSMMNLYDLAHPHRHGYDPDPDRSVPFHVHPPEPLRRRWWQGWFGGHRG